MFEPVSGVIAPRAPGGRPVIWAATGRFPAAGADGSSAEPFDRLNLATHVGDDPQAVRANRDAVRSIIRADHLVVMNAVHGADVREVRAPGEAPLADALICQTPGLGVMALGADCVTMGIVGDDDSTIAVVHCGWRGLVGDVVGATLSCLAERGVSPAHIVLGPAICGTCYRVDHARADDVRAACSNGVTAAALVPLGQGATGIDVRAGVVARLAEMGADGVPVQVVDGCTQEDPSLFSYRRDGVTGRQGLAMVRARVAESAPSDGTVVW